MTKYKKLGESRYEVRTSCFRFEVFKADGGCWTTFDPDGGLRPLRATRRQAIEAECTARYAEHKRSPEHRALMAEAGRTPREGFHLVRALLGGGIGEERDGTPWTCSVASETYWSS